MAILTIQEASAKAMLPFKKSLINVGEVFNRVFSKSDSAYTINVPLLTGGSAGLNTANIETAADAMASSTKTVTLSSTIDKSYKISAADALSTDVDYFAHYIELGAKEVAQEIIDTLLKQCRITNFSTYLEVNLTDFTGDGLGTIVGKANTMKLPKGKRFLVISDSSNTKLIQDDSLRALYATGKSEIIEQGIVPDMFGLKIRNYSFPSECQENAYLLTPDALCFALAPLKSGSKNVDDEYLMQDSESGLSFTVTRHYNPATRFHYVNVGTRFGYAVGNVDALCRITEEDDANESSSSGD